MKIRLDREQAEPLVWEETLELPLEGLESRLLRAVGPVRCAGWLHSASPGFLLRLGLDYRQDLVCTRCLGPVEQEISDSFEVLLMVHTEEGPREEEVELAEDDLTVIHLREETVDTEPIVREQLQLQIPMKPLCREGCRGLCPRCGADRNLSPDCCPETGYDSRWTDLAALRDRYQESDH